MTIGEPTHDHQTNQPNPLLPLPVNRFERITIRQLSQLPVIDFASLDPVKRQLEEERRAALLEQAAQVSEEKEKEHA